MNYQIETQPRDDLIVIRHFHYDRPEQLHDMLAEVAEHFKQHPYRRLLVDYTPLQTVKLDFVDKSRVLAQFASALAHIAHHVRQAVVTQNAFQKAIAQQARTLVSAVSEHNVSENTCYFSDVDSALKWLLKSD